MYFLFFKFSNKKLLTKLVFQYAICEGCNIGAHYYCLGIKSIEKLEKNNNILTFKCDHCAFSTQKNVDYLTII